MLRKLLMLMALLSGLTAMYAPERALAAQDVSSQVEAGEELRSEVETGGYAVDFEAAVAARAQPLDPLQASEPRIIAVPVLIGVDRARE